MTDYPFDMQLVVDPLNPENVVRDGEVYLYDPSDTAGVSPIAIRDPSGLPLGNPLTSNAYGFLQPTIVTIPRVKWKSGTFEGFFYSYDGLRNEAIAARAAAEAAQGSAATAGANAAAAASTALAGAVADAESAKVAAESAAALVNAPADAAIAAAVNGAGTATKAALNATYVPTLRPAKFLAVGDGVTNDSPALDSMYAATGDNVVLDRGKTYKLNSSITISKATDLNGATLNVTGRVTLTGRGTEIRNGTIITTDKVYALNQTKVRIHDLAVTNGTSGGNGITLEGCADIRVEGCTVTGGARGIVLTACDKFNVSHNKVNGLTAAGAKGILIYGKDNETHGGGTVTDNDVTDCMFGITLFGGEADSTKPGFLTQYNLENIQVTNNRVTVTTPDTLIGCIYATRSRFLNISHNVVTGGSDVGVDFEYCTQSIAEGNVITDILNGGLAAIFGSSYIKFTGNKVVYSRTKAARAASGATWANTGPLMVLLRDNPQHVEMKNNDFTVTNGTLGKVELGGSSGFVEFNNNTLHNCYAAQTNSAAGNVTDTAISRNSFTFDINTGSPVIYAERVLRWHCEHNTIVLMAGEVLGNQLRKYITVYDASGTTSDYVHIIGNTVDDKIGQGIGVFSASTTMHAWVTGNITDRITALWNGGAASTNLTYERNYKLASPGYTKLTAHDNAGLNPTVATLS